MLRTVRSRTRHHSRLKETSDDNQPGNTGRAGSRPPDGNQIPMLGLGVWQVPDGAECVNVVRWALELGYRHIDTARPTATKTASALRDSGVPRDQVFITTKFAPGRNDPAAEAEHSLKRLGVDHVDLYLVHWPRGGPVWAWPGMQRAHGLGHARSIGVSNFSVDDLDALLSAAALRPAVNQVQFSPFQYRRALLDACQANNVVLEQRVALGGEEPLPVAEEPGGPQRPQRWPDDPETEQAGGSDADLVALFSLVHHRAEPPRLVQAAGLPALLPALPGGVFEVLQQEAGTACPASSGIWAAGPHGAHHCLDLLNRRARQVAPWSRGDDRQRCRCRPQAGEPRGHDLGAVDQLCRRGLSHRRPP
jgi:hypothetical protein